MVKKLIFIVLLFSGLCAQSMVKPASSSKPVYINSHPSADKKIKIVKNVVEKHYVTKEYYATGVGVAPKNTISPAQAMVLAQRAAMLDAYRQLSETLYGVTINGHDMVQNSLVQNSIISSDVNAILRNAVVVKREFKNGYAEVMLKVKVNVEV